jgi:hypothetical protein
MSIRPSQRCIMPAFFLTALMLSAPLAWPQGPTSEERMRRDITFLASDECEGRGPGTKGLDKAADYIAKIFAESGLKPGGKEGYFQPFTIGGGATKLEGTTTLKLEGPNDQVIDLKLGNEFQVMGFSGSGKFSAPLVFAGYGIVAKEIGFDDFKDVDVAGKIVVLIRRTPRWGNKDMPFDGPRRDGHASLEKKQALAETKKAKAVLLVNDPSEAQDKLLSIDYAAGGALSSIPSMQVKRNVISMVLESALKKSLADIEKTIDKDLKPQSAALTGWTATLECNVKRTMVAVKNVIGVVEGSGPLADETVVVGAHYDHLGYGGFGSLAPNTKNIHHGADDNASGTTSVLELSRRFGAMKNREGRRIVFMTFSAEERGLLGSRHYCNKEPLFPLAKTISMVNLDMVGRLPEDEKTKKGKLIVEGLGTGKGFEKLIDKLNEDAGFQLNKKQGGFGPSDHDSFCRKDIPVFFFWNGTHKDYHKPSDTSDKINVPGMKRIADLAEKVIAHLASDPARPEFVKVAAPPATPKAKGPRLGIVPDYEEGKEGLRVADVQAEGAAAKAGIKAGDVIIAIGGQAVKNINTYMVLMASQKSGQAVEIGVLRDGKKLTLKATPQ